MSSGQRGRSEKSELVDKKEGCRVLPILPGIPYLRPWELRSLAYLVSMSLAVLSVVRVETLPHGVVQCVN